MTITQRLVLLALATCALEWGAPVFPAAKAVDSLIEDAIAKGQIPGAVLVVGHEGRVIYRKAYGNRALLPKPEPMTLDTIFDCASLTKVVATTTSVMELFEAGKIRIGDKVTDYIPEFQGGKSEITIRNLMTHYSGFRGDVTLVPPWSGYEEGVRRAATDVPVEAPETKFIYSDINFNVVAEIVHRVSGQMVDRYAREHVFEPLGMSTTMFLPAELLRPRIAPTEQLPTGEILRGVVDDPTARFMGGVAGDAGLFSTGDDLARFCQMMLGKGAFSSGYGKEMRLVSPLTVEYFTSPQSPAGGKDVRGLGWDIDSKYSGNRGELFPAGKSYGHTGYTGTSIWIDPASQTYLILLTNAVHPKAGKAITPLRKSVATAVAAAVGYPRRTAGNVRTGLDVLEAEQFRSLLGKRVGLITNHTGIDAGGRRNVDVMRAAGVRITALFSPEHGLAGTEDREDIANETDKATGLRVYSLFSQKDRRPTPEMLRDVDVVVFDIADVGARFYTYMTTMAYALEECARLHKPFMVLDRPNPITGLRVEGPMLDEANQSFIGYFPMPIRHGMTMGELARMFNGEKQLHADLTVTPMLNWTRDQWFDATGLPWKDPSPNIRNLTEATLYPALAMLEYSTNYSVGRGTSDPFELIGASWIGAIELAADLNARDIPGIRAYPAHFRPEANHYAGITLEGVHLLLTNRDIFSTERLGLEIAAALQKLYPGKIDLDANRKLIGSGRVIGQLKAGAGADQILKEEQGEMERFARMRARYLLYE